MLGFGSIGELALGEFPDSGGTTSLGPTRSRLVAQPRSDRPATKWLGTLSVLIAVGLVAAVNYGL